MFFGTLPSVVEGFQLRTWRGGPLAGQPKEPPALRTMVDRGLMAVWPGTPGPRAYFSVQGIAALRILVLDPRDMNLVKFAHVRAELGLAANEPSDYRARQPTSRRHPHNREHQTTTPRRDGRGVGRCS